MNSMAQKNTKGLGRGLDALFALAPRTPQNAAIGTLLHAQVRGKSVPMRVQNTPFVPTRYHRG